MRNYIIFHSIDKEKKFTEAVHQDRRLAGIIEAGSLEEAFLETQNEFNLDWRKKNQRSTSVGDLIFQDNERYLVKGIGFEKIPG